MRNLVLTIGMAAVAIAFCSCIDARIEIPTGHAYPRPLMHSLPMTVGVHYTAPFKEYQTVEEPRNIVISKSGEVIYSGFYNATTIDVGPVNIEFFNHVLASAFDEVLLVDAIPKDLLSVEDIDLIIEPDARNVDVDFAQVGMRLECNVQITYVLTMYLLRSGTIASWSIIGNGVTDDFFMLETGIKAATHRALRDISAKFYIGFCDRDDIKTLYREECGL
jgi:hypothetical protein